MTKRVTLLITILVLFPSLLFSFSFNGVGSTQTTFFEDDTTLLSAGVYLSHYNWSFNDDLGFFAQGEMNFPFYGKSRIDGYSAYWDFKSFNKRYIFSFLGGLAIKDAISYNSFIYYGIGPSVHYFLFENKDKEVSKLLYGGIGLSVGYVYLIGDYTFLDSGTIVDYNFYSYQNLSPDNSWSKLPQTDLFTVRYYIGFGFGQTRGRYY